MIQGGKERQRPEIQEEKRGVGADQMIAGPGFRIGGKSELHRAGWSLTATGGDPKESATEKIPPLPVRKR
jgi:hypothetical protein